MSSGWSVEAFANFWKKPDPKIVEERAGAILHPNVHGYWPQFERPVVGPRDYVAVIKCIINLVPDLSMEVLENASSDDLVFIRWMARGHYRGNSFERSGVDRLKVCGGIVHENRIFSDHELFIEVADSCGNLAAG